MRISDWSSDVCSSDLKGEILALIGPNGAGKTTCFNMIAGYMPPTEGKVIFDGKEVTGQKPYTLNMHGLARTFQVVKPLAKLSVFDNVMVACLSKSRNTKEAREKARVMLDRTNLAAMQDTPARSLSNGNLTRLEVARASATQPPILPLDQPLGDLNHTKGDKAN